jgi:hypothetical protein
MSDTTEMMNANETIAPVVAEQPKKAPVRRVLQTKKAVAPPPKAPTPPASEDEAESSADEEEAESSADEAPAPAPAPVAKSPSVKVLPMVEYKRLLEIEKEYNEMKAKYDVMVAKETAKKAKANEASKKSKAKKTKEVKEVKAKLEERVEKLEKLVIKKAVVEEDDETCKTEGCDNNGEDNGFCEECNAEEEE